MNAITKQKIVDYLYPSHFAGYSVMLSSVRIGIRSDDYHSFICCVATNKNSVSRLIRIPFSDEQSWRDSKTVLPAVITGIRDTGLYNES